ncbi:unnamed protein product [Mytilus coruscus]|uniref:SAP domain-containing protein n=1 Tax=Mytilus coruscus TaxID=42192 RepID=A0A6J8F1Q0_MYTCO|nr:unnamed protein product [Mytilus coruscus]
MSNYGSWSLPQLKEELRKRKARISGRKHELIERLEAYDRNKDFGNQDEVGEEYSMTLPDSFLYKDFNSGTEFVDFKMETIEVYLKPMDKHCIIFQAMVKLYPRKHAHRGYRHSTTVNRIKAPDKSKQSALANKKGSEVQFDPRPAKGVSKFPISQLYPPANVYAVASDHDYLEGHPEDSWLKDANISHISEDRIKYIESSTTGQSKIRFGNRRDANDFKLQISDVFVKQQTELISII